MKEQQRLLRNLAGQWAIILFFPAAFLLTAFLSGMGPGTHRIRHMGAAMLLSVAVVFCILVWLFLFVKDKEAIKGLRKKICSDCYLYAVLLVSGILRSFSLNVMQRWDAGEYYYKLGTACENFDFSFRTFFEQFRLCGHPTLMFAPIYAIGDFLAPRRIWGMELMNLVLTLAAIGCIYRILERILPDTTERRLGLYTLLVSFGPLFLGTFQNFNPDMGITLFVVFVLYSCIYKQYFLLLFWSCVVVQTKETGIVMQAGLVLGLILYDFFSEKRNLKERIQAVRKNPCTWLVGISILLQLGYMKLIGGLTTWASSEEQQFRWDNNGMNCFGIRMDYIWTKWKQFFILNFNWIYVIIIIVGILLVVSGRRHVRKLPQGLTLLWSISGCLFLFLNLYITAALPRYNLFCDLVLAITGVVVIETILSKTFRYKLAIPCVVLMLGQSFLTVDPISRAVFSHVETGGPVSMLYMQMPSEERFYVDTIVYNYQYTFIDRALDRIFPEGVQENAVNVVHFGGSYGDGSQFNGNWWQDWVPYKVRWDKKANKRVYYKGDDTVRINVFGEEWLIGWFEKGKVEEFDEAVLIFLPQFEYNEKECLKQLEPLFEIGEKQAYRSVLGCVNYYKVKAKNN